MIKVKTRSSAKKRFKRVGAGGTKIKRSKAFRRHLLTSKNRKRKRRLRESAYVNTSDMGRVRKMLPYT